jgi:ACR3 family arsenite efflux pump ArsB
MTLDQFINVLVTVTLIEMMAAIGLAVTVTDLVGVARNVRLIVRAAAANYVLVPVITVNLLLLFDVHTALAAESSLAVP